MLKKDPGAATRRQARRQLDRADARSVGTRLIAPSRRRQAALAVSAALLAPAAWAGPAQAAIEVDHGIEFVNLTNLPENTPLQLTVADPTGKVIGTKTFETATGAFEVNHIGAEEGDCFDGSTSPDIRPGDTLSVEGNTGLIHRYTVADVRYAALFEPADAAAGTPETMVVSGWARPFGQLTPLAAPELRLQDGPFASGTDVLGGSLDANRGNRLLIGPDLDPTGAFQDLRVFPVADGQIAEAILEVIEGENATSFSGDASFALPGCPPLDATRGPVTVPPLPAPKPTPQSAPQPAPLPAIVERLLTRTVVQQAPVAGAVAGAKASPAKLTIKGLTMSRALARAAVRANGLRARMRLMPGTKLLRIRIYRKNLGGTRSLVAERFQVPTAGGVSRVRLADRRLRQALTAGSYEAEVAAGRGSRTSLGKASKFAFRITP